MILVILSALVVVTLIVATVIHFDQPYIESQIDRDSIEDWHNFRAAFSVDGDSK
jgi:hypothetical protein